MVADEISKDEEGWRVKERYCIDHRAAFDMDEIINDIFMRATDFIYESGLRIDGDHVGKLEDLYFWCSVCGAKNWGI